MKKNATNDVAFSASQPTMVDGLAIITGVGGLSEEVVGLAKDLTCRHTRFTIKPWLPIASFSKGATALHPFRFSHIAEVFGANKIKNVFLTGHFPWGRLLQANLSPHIWRLARFGDDRFARTVAQTDSRLANAVRYFISLGELLEEMAVSPLLAGQIFPNLNLPAGCVSERKTPPEVIDELPRMIAQMTRYLDLTRYERHRFSQAVIIDRGVIIDTEKWGTDNLLQRYQRRQVKRVKPYLLKLPSAEFSPALDQPAIGPDTVKNCHAAGVCGIVVCAETTVIAKHKEMMEVANARGMFVHAIPLATVRKSVYR